MMNKRDMLMSRLEMAKQISENMQSLGIASEDINMRLLQIVDEVTNEMKEIEREEQREEYNNVIKARKIISSEYLSRELARKESYELLQKVRILFGRDYAFDKSGLKSWLTYLGYVCEYSEDKDKDGWSKLTIKKVKDEEDDESI